MKTLWLFGIMMCLGFVAGSLDDIRREIRYGKMTCISK